MIALDRDELVEHLRTRVGFPQKSGRGFDEGDESEAARLAVAVRDPKVPTPTRSRSRQPRSGSSATSSVGSWRRMCSWRRLELGGGIDPELGGEELTRPMEGGESIALAPAGGEGEHEKAPQALPQGMRADQRLELGDEFGVPAEVELGADAFPDPKKPSPGIPASSFQVAERVIFRGASADDGDT